MRSWVGFRRLNLARVRTRLHLHLSCNSRFREKPMPHCLMLTPYPIVAPKHGGQVRAASIGNGARKAGWRVSSVGVFPSAFFPPEEWGTNDIVLDSAALTARVRADMAFADFHVARAASADQKVVGRLRHLIQHLAPDVIHVEQPWSWLILREALPSDHRIKIIYSSQNLEWRARVPLFKLALGLQNAASEVMIEATRLLELEFARQADLVMSISDLEQSEIEQTSGRPVIYLPAAGELTSSTQVIKPRFADEARSAECRYAALLGSNYWPNVEGFFDQFEHGLGFLAQGEQIWIAGTIGRTIRDDPRFHDFLSINESRSRMIGYVRDEEKAEFFDAAACVIVPVTIGAGAKLKTADAIFSGKPVVATPHALEGYGPIIEDARGMGVYEGRTPSEFRLLVRHAIRESLSGCTPEVCARLSMATLSAKWARHANSLLSCGSIRR
jgi:hypothetical protein